MPQYYFDNEYLLNYMKQDVELQVYVNREYLTIADEGDLDDPNTGYGIMQSGKPVKFNYKAIEHVKVDDIIFDKKDLQASKEAEEKDETEEETPEGDGTGDTEEPEMGAEDIDSTAQEEPGAPEDEENKPPKESRHIKKDDYVVDIRDGIGGRVTFVQDDVLIFEYYNPDFGKMLTRTVSIHNVDKGRL